jgi:hypothetical protein
MAESAPVSRADTDTRLAECEVVIERGLETFMEVGAALAEIKRDRLYRRSYPSFEGYLKVRWKMSRFYAHRLIESSKVVKMLPTGNTPTSERQIRPLTRLKDPKQRAEAWTEAVETAPDGKPTAKHVESVVKKRSPARRCHRVDPVKVWVNVTNCMEGWVDGLGFLRPARLTRKQKAEAEKALRRARTAITRALKVLGECEE